MAYDYHRRSILSHHLAGSVVLAGILIMQFAILGVPSEITPSVIAQTSSPPSTLPYDLKLFSLSQEDGRYSDLKMGPNQDVTIKRCGCYLAALATVMGYYFGYSFGFGNDASSMPHFPVELYHPTPEDPSGINKVYGFYPHYLDKYLMAGPPNNPQDLGFGYKMQHPGECGMSVHTWALQNAARAKSIYDERGNEIAISHSGVSIKSYDDLQVDVINENLRNGFPTLVTLQKYNADGSLAGLHVNIIVGWDENRHEYRILDPAEETGVAAHVPFPSPSKKSWNDMVVLTTDIKPSRSATWLYVSDDPAPFEFLSTNPDGQKSGFDLATNSFLNEDPSASVYRDGGWADPSGVVPPGDPQNSLGIRNPIDGTYRIETIGTGDGPLKLNFSTISEDLEKTDLRAVQKNITKDQSYKYEVNYSSTGVSTISEVSNFTPESRAGDDVNGLRGTEINFNASQSFDADGSIVSYSWDFGDGTPSRNGNLISHSYDKPGTYNVKLTVTDNNGATDTDTLIVSIPDPNHFPVSDAGIDQTVIENTLVTLNGTGSFDPDPGDTLAYSWVQTGGSNNIILTTGDPNTATPSFTAPDVDSAGDVLTFELTARDTEGKTATDTVAITVNRSNQLPVANAVPAFQTVSEGSTDVTLDGSTSTDSDSAPPDNDSLTYHWKQISGQYVALNSTNTPAARFNAPANVLGENENLSFELTVTDNQGAKSSDWVTVVVNNDNNVNLPGEEYVFYKKWAGGQFACRPDSGRTTISCPESLGPDDIAFDSQRNITYVADTWNDRVQKFYSNGTFITKWGSFGSGQGQFNLPRSIAADSSTGDVYVADTNNDRIQKFTNEGRFITMWNSYGYGFGSQFQTTPAGIAADSSTNFVYITDSQQNRVLKFSKFGAFITSWGGFGSTDGRFNFPTDISVDSSGNVYVADKNNDRIQKFDGNGMFLKKWGSSFFEPESIAADSAKDIYVSPLLSKYSTDGTLITRFNNIGFTEPCGVGSETRTGITVDSAGNFVYVLYQGDKNDHCVKVFVRDSIPVAIDQSVSTDKNSAVNVTLTGKDRDIGDTLTYSIVTQPLNGTLSSFDSSTGKVTYTPNANYSGTDSFTFKANDGKVNSVNNAKVSIRIDNHPPVAVDQSVSTAKDTPVNITLTGNDTDLDVDILRYSIVKHPLHGTLGKPSLSSSSADYIYSPNANFTGNDIFTFRVDDGSVYSGNNGTVSISVKSLPIAIDDIATTSRDTSVIINVLDNDKIPSMGGENGEDYLNIVSVSSPVYGITNINTNGTITYTPNAGFYGIDSFNYTVSSASDGYQATATVKVNIASVNDPPVANSQNITTTENTSININLTGSDTNGDPLRFFTYSAPLHGFISRFNSTTGFAEYTPLSFYSGSDSFTFGVNDGEIRSKPATVSISINDDGINDGPTAVSDRIVTDENVPILIDVLANDVDPNGDPLTITNVKTLPSNGLSSVNANGTITYTPNPDFYGIDAFVYTVSDGNGGFDLAQVIIEVNPVKQSHHPIANAGADRTVNESATGIMLDGSASHDEDGTISSYRWTQTAGSEVIVTGANTATPTFTAPSVDQDTTLTFSLTVIDNEGLTSIDADTVDILVKNINQPPDISKATPSPDMLWPPNHKMVKITIQNVVDPEGNNPITIKITKIMQDEPVNGLGDGDISPDASGINTNTAQIRSERTGTGDGRVYHIFFTATDSKGQSANGEVVVSVPYDQSGRPATDSGPQYDSTLKTSPTATTGTQRQEKDTTPPAVIATTP